MAAAIAGAATGRGMGRLIDHLALAGGFSSPGFHRAGGSANPLGSLPVAGHFLSPAGTRSGRALAIELLTGAAFAACWVAFPAAKAACGFVLLAGLIGASCVDLDQMIIPDLFTIGLALAGLVLSAAVPALHGMGAPSALSCLRSVAAAMLGMAVGSSLALWISLVGEWLLGKELLGFGDVKFLGAIGAFCGWQGAVFSVFGGAVVGALALIAAEAVRRLAGDARVQLFRVESPGGGNGRIGWNAHFPFGPMLAAAAAAYFLAAHPWADRYLGRYLVLF